MNIHIISYRWQLNCRLYYSRVQLPCVLWPIARNLCQIQMPGSLDASIRDLSNTRGTEFFSLLQLRAQLRFIHPNDPWAVEKSGLTILATVCSCEDNE